MLDVKAFNRDFRKKRAPCVSERKWILERDLALFRYLEVHLSHVVL